MFPLIPSVESILQDLLPAFTAPSFQTHLQIFLGWIMCLGRRTEYGVFQTIQGDDPAPGNDSDSVDIDIKPAETKPTTSTVVTDDDWMIAVTKAPVIRPMMRGWSRCRTKKSIPKRT